MQNAQSQGNASPPRNCSWSAKLTTFAKQFSPIIAVNATICRQIVVCVIVKHAVFKSFKSNFKSTNDNFSMLLKLTVSASLTYPPLAHAISKQDSLKHFEIFVTLAASCWMTHRVWCLKAQSLYLNKNAFQVVVTLLNFQNKGCTKVT